MMIRTRNFLLYIACMVFLVSAVGFTVTKDIAQADPAKSNLAANSIVAVSDDVPTGAEVADIVLDRDAYIAAMQQKIARGEGRIPGAPVVLTSVDAPSLTEPPVVTERSVQWCETPQELGDVIGA